MTRLAWNTWRVRSHQTTTTTTTYTTSTDDYVCMATRRSDVLSTRQCQASTGCGYDGSTSGFGDRERERGGRGKEGEAMRPGNQRRRFVASLDIRCCKHSGRDRTADCTVRWRLPSPAAGANAGDRDDAADSRTRRRVISGNRARSLCSPHKRNISVRRAMKSTE